MAAVCIAMTAALVVVVIIDILVQHRRHRQHRRRPCGKLHGVRKVLPEPDGAHVRPSVDKSVPEVTTEQEVLKFIENEDECIVGILMVGCMGCEIAKAHLPTVYSQRTADVPMVAVHEHNLSDEFKSKFEIAAYPTFLLIKQGTVNERVEGFDGHVLSKWLQ